MVAYHYHFLVAPACPLHWPAYLKTIEEMKRSVDGLA
jgi:hypothetical protein